MPIKQPDPIYQGDSYPLDGCTIVIEIRALDYQVAMYQPGAQRANHHLSRLVMSDSTDVAEHVRRLLDKEDQRPEAPQGSGLTRRPVSSVVAEQVDDGLSFLGSRDTDASRSDWSDLQKQRLIEQELISKNAVLQRRTPSRTPLRRAMSWLEQKSRKAFCRFGRGWLRDRFLCR